MFGQAMATFIPPMLPGTVVFMRGYNPADIVGADQVAPRLGAGVGAEDSRRAARARPARGARGRRRRRPKQHVARRWWRYRRIHRLFGLKFWSFVVGAAPLEPELEAFWGELGFVVVQGYGLTETAPIVTLESSVRHEEGIGRQGRSPASR